jgi:predicted metal-dependent hydrolase
LSYTLIRSRRRKKTLSLQVQRDGAVIIHVPFHTPQADIDRFMKEREQWLRRKILEQQAKKNDQQARAFIPGERFLYLGESYVLNLDERADAGKALIFNGREFLLQRHALHGVRVLFHLWYQKQARLHLEERVHYFSRMMGLSPQGVAIGNARSRWGSCAPDNRLTFAWRLIMAPPDVIDYVVVHELSHIKIRNHSRDYWRFVEHMLPGCKRQRGWLKDHGHRLAI